MIDLNILVTGGVGVCTTIIGSWVSWFFTRKKYNSEVDHNQIDNMNDSLDFYTKLVDDNKSRLDDLIERNQSLENEIGELSRDNQAMRLEMQELRGQILALTLNICMDLTCANRVRENQNIKRINGKNKDRFNQSPEPCKG